MKKILLMVMFIFIIVGCKESSSARDASINYLNDYVNLDENIENQIKEQVTDVYDNEEIRDKYIEVLERQYINLEYEIINEKYDNEYAYVTVRVKVYNLYNAQEEAMKAINVFVLDNGEYDRDGFTLYKLNKMLEWDERVIYDIVIKLINENDRWEVLQLSNENLEKLHGIYNYKGL